MERANRKKFWQKQSFKSNAYGNAIWKLLPRSMEPDDVRKLLKKRHNLRDKCIILILLRTGIRICELLALKPQDINLKKRIAIIHSSAKTGIFQRLDQTQRAFKHQNFGLIDVF